MTQLTAQRSPVTIGLDVGDRNIHYCVLDAAREVVARTYRIRPRGMRPKGAGPGRQSGPRYCGGFWRDLGRV